MSASPSDLGEHQPAAADREVRDRRDAFMQSLAEGLAHELKNPLSILRMNIQLLREDFKSDDSVVGRRVAKRAEVLDMQSNRLQETIGEFLRFAQGQTLELRLCNVNDLLRELLDFIAGELPKSNIRLLTSLPDNLPPIHADSKVLKQALLNILINAQQAITGIAPENVDRIFHVYFSTKEGGTGLGLPTARRIIEQHGGTVHLHSVPGKGTSFSVRMPVSGPTNHSPSEGDTHHVR